MRFCKICDNMLYISLQQQQQPQKDADDGMPADKSGPGSKLQLTYACKHCGHVEVDRDASSSDTQPGAQAQTALHQGRVMSTNYVDDQTTYKQHATRYIKYDPTLPRVSNIPCPRKAACTRPEGQGQRVIYIKYDATNLKFIYCCEYCGAFWKSSDGTTSASGTNASGTNASASGTRENKAAA